MLSEKYRPTTWEDFVGQPIIPEIEAACAEPDLFQHGGERWLFESDGIAGCGKTSAAYVVAGARGIDPFNAEWIDSRAVTIAEFREISDGMYYHGWGPSGRRAYIIDEIQPRVPAIHARMAGIPAETRSRDRNHDEHHVGRRRRRALLPVATVPVPQAECPNRSRAP